MGKYFVLCPFIHVLFIELQQGIGAMVGSVDRAIKDIGFLLRIQDWSVKPKYTVDNVVAKYNKKM